STTGVECEHEATYHHAPDLLLRSASDAAGGLVLLLRSDGAGRRFNPRTLLRRLLLLRSAANPRTTRGASPATLLLSRGPSPRPPRSCRVAGPRPRQPADPVGRRTGRFPPCRPESGGICLTGPTRSPSPLSVALLSIFGESRAT